MDFLKYNRLHVNGFGSLHGTVTPPASKSSSTRALLAASLTSGISTIQNLSSSNNVRAMLDSCQNLGASISSSVGGLTEVRGTAELNSRVTLCPGNSGIVLRLLMGATAILPRVTFITPYADSLGRRSNTEMIGALRSLGVECATTRPDDRLPISLNGTAVHGGTVEISGRRSSQFLSGLLFLGALLDEPLTVSVTDEIRALPMVSTTLNSLRTGGIVVETSDDLLSFHVPAGTRFKPARYTVGSDPASTAALLAAAAAVDSDVRLEGVHIEEMDGVLEYLRAVGADIRAEGSTLIVHGGGELRAADFDGLRAPDAVLPLAALMARADGTTRFRNVEHLRYKECDRISDFRRELQRAGVAADERRDELIIHGSRRVPDGGVEVDSHYDHGVVFAMSVLALASGSGLTINNPQYVAQTYPAFFADLTRLGAAVTVPDARSDV